MKIPRAFRRRRLQVAASTAAVLMAAGGLQLFSANPAVSQTPFLTAFDSANDPGMDPGAAAWKKAVPLQVPLSAQGASYATGGGSIATVSAQALHFKDKLYLRIEWDDATQDQSTVRVQDFSDAVAVEFPAKSAASVPSICMGQANGGVNIWQWRADSEAGIKDPADVYTSSLVESYPSKDALWYTARAAGNPYANPEQGPVQTLTAESFGTLTIANLQDVKGKGVYANGKWAVVFARQYAGFDSSQATFTNSTRTDMAFAVWNGSEGDRNGRKSVSQFVQLSISGAALSSAKSTPNWTLYMAAALLVGVTAVGAGLAAFGVREGRRR